MTIYFTLQETNISPQKWHFEDDFFFPKVGYVNLLEGIYFTFHFHTLHTSMHTWHALTGFTYQKRSPFPGKVLTSGVPGGWHFNLNLNLIWTWWLPKKQRLTFFLNLKDGDGLVHVIFLLKQVIFRFHVNVPGCIHHDFLTYDIGE